MSNKPSFNKALEFCAFIGTAFIAIALILAVCFKGNNTLYTSFQAIGEAIAYVLTMILAGFWVSRKRGKIVWLIFYIIFVVAIVVLYILKLVR